MIEIKISYDYLQKLRTILTNKNIEEVSIFGMKYGFKEASELALFPTKIKCPRCSAVGTVECMPDFKGKYQILWTKDGKEHAKDTMVKFEDLQDSTFGCGYDK